MTKLITAMLSILIVSACGGVAKNSLDENAVARSRAYTKNMQVLGVNDKKALNTLLCPGQKKTLLNKKWNQLVDCANACVQKKKWEMTKLIGKKLARETSFSPWGPYYLSLVAEDKGNMNKAFWMIDLAIKKGPQVGLLYYQRARLQWKLNKLSLSIADFKRSLALNSKLVEPHMFLAQIFLRDRELAASEEHFEKALALDPGKFEALTGLAKIAFINGNKSEEQAYLEKARRLKPKNVWVKKQLSKFVAKNSLRDPATKGSKNLGGSQ